LRGVVVEEEMKKLMHNVELLVITTGSGNWKSAREAISNARLLLGEIDRRIQSNMEAEARGRERERPRTVRLV